MNYIIDPMWFYWINVVNWIKGVVLAIAILTLVVAFVHMIIMCDDMDWSDDEANSKKWCIVYVAIAIGFFLVSAFVPSKQTLIEMQVAKFATYENVEWTVETIKQAVDYIVEAVGSLK